MKLVITGTSPIDEPSRKQVFNMMGYAKKNDCNVCVYSDYRHWNWPDKSSTRSAYQKAEKLSDVIVGNEEEFKILKDKLTIQVKQSMSNNQIMILKRGQNGCTLYSRD